MPVWPDDADYSFASSWAHATAAAAVVAAAAAAYWRWRGGGDGWCGGGPDAAAEAVACGGVAWPRDILVIGII